MVAKYRPDDGIEVIGARQNNLADLSVTIPGGLTVVTGVSGSGKSTLVFDTIQHEATRRFMEVYGPSSTMLAPAAVDEIRGLRPSIAVDQDRLNRNPNSTVATASGLHPFLRLLFARAGEHRCPRCHAATQTIAADELRRRVTASSEARAIVVNGVVGRHGSLIDALSARFGDGAVRADGRPVAGAIDASIAHTIEVDLPRDDPLETLAQLGAEAVSIDGEILSTSNACVACGTWLERAEPAHFHRPCPFCGGEDRKKRATEVAGCERCHFTGMHPLALAVTWQGHSFPDVMGQSIEGFMRLLEGVRGGIEERLLHECRRRLHALESVGLGYLHLDRTAPSLSRGEGQRLRIAVALTATLEDLLHVLDEPTVGLHPTDVHGVFEAIETLPGPVLMVEHERLAVAEADAVIEIGPGAGSAGGQVVGEGPPATFGRDTATGRMLAPPVGIEVATSDALTFFELEGASRHNLKNVSVRFARRRLNVVTGVSGSGKSTLVKGELVDAVAAGERVTPPFAGEVLVVDQSPIGRNPRSNPATYTKLSDVIRDWFASETDLSASHFSFNRPEGACPECEGMGAIEEKLRYLPSAWVPCTACQGTRFSDDVRARSVEFLDRRFSIDQIMALSIADFRTGFEQVLAMKPAKRRTGLRTLDALVDVGLGYLPLGQPSTTLSGGEAQRVKLARHLSRVRRQGKEMLIILDEPTTGLHADDVAVLLAIFERLTDEGATLVVIEHDTHVIRSADWIVDLGPGAGPRGGEVVVQGRLADVRNTPRSKTAEALLAESSTAIRGEPRSRPRVADGIRIEGARANNLRDVSTSIPHGQLTVVTGRSGSGKSSLVRDVIEVEARRRYLESLSMYERQGVKESSDAAVRELAGLGVTLPLGRESRLRNPRHTVGDEGEINRNLATLMSVLGSSGEIEPRRFMANVYGSACTTCHGVGHLRKPVVEKLIIHPDKPLCAGAMYSPGFYPQGYFGKPYNGGYDILQHLAELHSFDPFVTPWQDMTEEAQQAFLFGVPERMNVTFRSRKGREYVRDVRFGGCLASGIRDWDTGGTYTVTQRCPACEGGRLRPEYLAVRLNGATMADLSAATMVELARFLDGVERPAERSAALRAFDQLRRMTRLLTDLGLGYLAAVRSTSSLSAGEAQRLQLARAIAGGLTGMTVLLDEPTRGMHPAEVASLIGALREVTDLGNTAVVVEHDLDVIRAADWIIEMGPESGEHGGMIVASGEAETLAHGYTADWLSGQRQLQATPSVFEPSRFIDVHGARGNNLKDLTVRIPLGGFVGVCGRSGSGKSTLILDTLARVIAPRKSTSSVERRVSIEPAAHDAIEGAPPRAIVLDQTREGIHSPVSFLGLKKAFEQRYVQSEAAVALGAGIESCDACGGRGVLHVDMGFLPNVYPVCETCAGSGYGEAIREIEFRGVSLEALLGMSIDAAFALWHDDPKIARPLERARAVSLGYLTLQQPARSLSGGEVQRLRIAKELARKQDETLYIFDEPTTGLHLEDVAALVDVFRELVTNGASVIVIEHNTQVLAQCDWLIELGPGGGPDGGQIVFNGRPQDLDATPTAPFIAAALADG